MKFGNGSKNSLMLGRNNDYEIGPKIFLIVGEKRDKKLRKSGKKDKMPNNFRWAQYTLPFFSRSKFEQKIHEFYFETSFDSLCLRLLDSSSPIEANSSCCCSCLSCFSCWSLFLLILDLFRSREVVLLAADSFEVGVSLPVSYKLLWNKTPQ